MAGFTSVAASILADKNPASLAAKARNLIEHTAKMKGSHVSHDDVTDKLIELKKAIKTFDEASKTGEEALLKSKYMTDDARKLFASFRADPSGDMRVFNEMIGAASAENADTMSSLVKRHEEMEKLKADHTAAMHKIAAENASLKRERDDEKEIGRSVRTKYDELHAKVMGQSPASGEQKPPVDPIAEQTGAAAAGVTSSNRELDRQRQTRLFGVTGSTEYWTKSVMTKVQESLGSKGHVPGLSAVTNTFDPRRPAINPLMSPKIANVMRHDTFAEHLKD